MDYCFDETINLVEDNTTYFWKVIAEDLSGATRENTGGFHSFRVNTANDPPGEFDLLAPEHNSMITDLTPTFHWEVPLDPDDRSRSIVSYDVYVGEDEWMEVGAYVYRHFDDICGVSFLPKEDDSHSYVQAPYELSLIHI